MWDIRYRPLKFSDVLGQQGTVSVLKSRLRNKTALDTSYVFFGGAGMGKTTLARILARTMLCERLNLEDPDPCNECDNCQAILTETSTAFVEKDAASQGTIEHVRAIVEELPFAVFGASKRIYLFDECFTADTLLVTENGVLDIKTLVETKSTDRVMSFDLTSRKVVWKPITDWFQIADKRTVIKLFLDNGVTLTVTEEQEIYTENRGWVKAKDLTSEDDITESRWS